MTAVLHPQSAQLSPLNRSLVRGAAGGLAGGMMLAMFAMLVAIGEDGFWSPVRGITSVVFGDEHYGGGFEFGPVVVGLMAHMMNSVMLGAAFAVVAGRVLKRPSLASALSLGMAFGLVTWLAMVVVVSGILQDSDLFADAVPAWAWIAGHAMFGLVTGGVWARFTGPRS
ncbi:MAG: DUF6789 family protein [Dehalococcoidia bacterium]